MNWRNNSERQKLQVPNITVAVLMAVLSVAPMCAAQGMQKGISVELAVAINAEPVPDADKENALIVTITDNGSVYLGTTQIKSDVLAKAIKEKISDPQQKIYLKVDARTPYSQVETVLQVAQSAGAYDLILLTAQPAAAKPQRTEPPQGLAVRTRPLGGLSPFEFALVEVLYSGQQEPILKIKDNQVAGKDLRGTLWQMFKKQPGGSVGVEVDGKISFAELLRVVDICRSTGAKVSLVLGHAKNA